MTSSRPYLLRALYEWIVDNDLTPHILVDAEMQGVDVPRQYIQNGQITLNVSPSAVQSLEISNEWLSFNARFSGQAMTVFAPCAAVLGIYARENSQGMMFPPELFNDEPPVAGAGFEPEDEPPETPQPPKRGRPSLKVVK